MAEPAAEGESDTGSDSSASWEDPFPEPQKLKLPLRHISTTTDHFPQKRPGIFIRPEWPEDIDTSRDKFPKTKVKSRESRYTTRNTSTTSVRGGVGTGTGTGTSKRYNSYKNSPPKTARDYTIAMRARERAVLLDPYPPVNKSKMLSAYLQGATKQQRQDVRHHRTIHTAMPGLRSG